MSWRDLDLEDEPPHVVTHDHSRAVIWGALAVALLAVAGIVFSLVQ